VTRLLLFSVNAEELYGYKDILIKSTNGSIFDVDRRDFPNLYFKAVLVKIKKVFIIFR
jgi:hypothetical protein